MRIFGNVQFSFKTENGPKVWLPLKTIPSLADVSGPPAPSALLPYLEILYFLSYLFLHRSARHAHLSIFYVVEFPTGRNYMSGKHRLFDSCFWTQPPKTQQLIGVSLNSLWMERLRPLRGGNRCRVVVVVGLHTILKLPNQTTWDLSRSGSIVPLNIKILTGVRGGCRDIPRDYNVGRVA